MAEEQGWVEDLYFPVHLCTFQMECYRTRFQYCCYCLVAKLCQTLCKPMDCSMPGFPVFTLSRRLLKLMSTESMMPSNHLIPCRPLLLMPSILFSIKVFSNKSVHCIKVSKVLELRLQHQSFQWISRVDFLQDWLVWSPFCARDSQESSPTPQFESINSSVLSLLYSPTHIHMNTGKTTALTIQTFVRKVISLLFNMLSRFSYLSSLGASSL